MSEPNFYDALADELNARTNQIDAEWETATCNDVAHGVIYVWGMDSKFPTHVSINFDNAPAVNVFTVCSSVNGERETVYEGKDRNTAIAFAIAKALQIDSEWVRNDVEHGFEHYGSWITDRSKSPCGRFDLTPEESEKLYGPAS